MIYTTTEIRKHTESEKMSQKKATNALFFSSVPSVPSVVEKKNNDHRNTEAHGK